jgi:diguanylate cyclase (GGDEF)-like protein/PAS domain S-box-containing protein
MPSQPFRLSQIIALAIASLGVYVVSGWMLGIEMMVRIVPNSVAMGVNAALLFIAAAVCLWPASWPRAFSRLPTLCAWLLILLPCAILFEHWRDINLGIDWTALHATVKDGNPRPGRVAPNTCIGFLFTGLALLILSREQTSRALRRTAAFLAYATLLIGVSALIGYALQLEAMYQVAAYNRMAAPTAVGMSFVGFGLWLRLRQRHDAHAAQESPEKRIIRSAALVLTATVLITGIVAFGLLKQGFEESMVEAVVQATKNNAANFEATLDQRMVLASMIATRPALQNHLLRLSTDPNDQEALTLAREAGTSFLPFGISGIRFFNAQGAPLVTIGKLVDENAVMARPLHRIGQQAALLWQDGFVLRTENVVMRSGRIVGKTITEQRLPTLTEILQDTLKQSASTDILVCGREHDDAVCFPTRFYAANMHIPMYKNGKPYLAISRALLGQNGAITVKDLRGIPVLAGYAPIGDLGLGMVLKTDTLDMFTPIRHRINVLGGLLLALVVAGTFFMRAQIQPLARRVVKEQQRIEVILESSHEAFIGMDQSGLITDWNAQAAQLFGWTRAEVLGRELAEVIIPPELRDAHRKGMARFVQTGEGPVLGKRIELPALHRNGTPLQIEITISVLKGESDYRFSAFLHDISDRKRAEATLFNEKERLRVTLNSIGDAVITTDTTGQVTYLNPVAEALTGWTTQEAMGLPLSSVFHIVNEMTDEIAPNPVELVLHSEKISGLAESTSLIQRGGTRIPIEDSAAPIRDAQGTLLGVVLVFHDVTQARKMAAEMTHQATHDALTGLINRREFERRLERAIDSGKHQDAQHSMLYLDLDQFKIVNDTCGHVAGDELLRQLTAVMQEKLRKGDTLARLGGDEFGVLLENCSTEPANRIADLLRRTVGEFHFTWLDKTFPIGVSIGLVTFSNGGVALADILRMADAACYVAKDTGRNRIHVYTPGDKEVAQRSGEMGWISRIQKALDEQRLVLYSQKILALGSTPDAGEHYEVLLRMHDEEGVLIPPMAFIPAAERYGLMPLLDRWVIQTAFALQAQRQALGTPLGTCAINLSGTTICDDYFLEFVKDQFARHHVAPQSICFEVTETAAITNLSQAATLIRDLKALGCRFALDDFGSGMSSFAYLKYLPVDYLKIDGAFVKNMLDDPIDYAMVESINHIGHVMGIETIAEFAENEGIVNALQKIGVNFAQGYGVEVPRPI